MDVTSLSTPAWGRSLDRSTKLLPWEAREHNRSLVLRTLIAGESLSRADIARETKLTRVTVSDLIAELIDEGLVVELGLRAEGRPGKPATMLEVDAGARHIVGLDLSEVGRFRAGLFDLSGTRVWHHTVETGQVTGQAAADIVLDLAQQALDRKSTR